MACCSRTPFSDCFDFFVGHGDFGLFRAQLFVAFDLDLGHDFKAGLEAQRLVVLNVEIGDLRLRHRDQSLLVGFFAEVARDQSFHHIALQIFRKPLADNGGGHMSAAEARDARQLLIFLDQGIRSRGLLPRREFQPRSPAGCCCWSQWGSHLPFRLGRSNRSISEPG